MFVLGSVGGGLGQGGGHGKTVRKATNFRKAWSYLFCALTYPRLPEQCLEHSMYFKNIS